MNLHWSHRNSAQIDVSSKSVTGTAQQPQVTRLVWTFNREFALYAIIKLITEMQRFIFKIPLFGM